MTGLDDEIGDHFVQNSDCFRKRVAVVAMCEKKCSDLCRRRGVSAAI